MLSGADLIRRPWSTKEGVGETSGQAAGSSLRGVRSDKSGPVEETSFLRSVRIRDPQFHRANAQVKFGPDVFADALVLFGAPVLLPPGQTALSLFPTISNPIRTAGSAGDDGHRLCPGVCTPLEAVVSRSGARRRGASPLRRIVTAAQSRRVNGICTGPVSPCQSSVF